MANTPVLCLINDPPLTFMASLWHWRAASIYLSRPTSWHFLLPLFLFISLPLLYFPSSSPREWMCVYMNRIWPYWWRGGTFTFILLWVTTSYVLLFYYFFTPTASLRSELNHIHASAIEHLRQTHQQESAAAKAELEKTLDNNRKQVGRDEDSVFHHWTNKLMCF